MDAAIRLLLSMLLLASPALSEVPGDENVLRNWPAPPYWTPSLPAEPASREAVASGRTALAGGAVALPFVALFPCRLVDTRAPLFPAPLGGGFLPPATVRSYTLTGVCGLPANAKAVSLNATVVNPTGPGFLTLYPDGGAFPPVSTLNFLGHDVIVNAAVVPLSATGGISMALGVSGGDVILDTNGYYTDVPSVTSLNTLTGDVTLSAGSHVTVTPGGGTLTVAAVGASANAASTLVARDASGSFAAGTITGSLVGNVTGNVAGSASLNVLKTGDTVSGSLVLDPGSINFGAAGPGTTAAAGSVLKLGAPFLHDYGTANTFLGVNAGNYTMTGWSNTAIGSGALGLNTSGSDNTGGGDGALAANKTGDDNTAFGTVALVANTSGSRNTAVGSFALHANVGGHDETASGYGALRANTAGDNNSAFGSYAMYLSTAGSGNTAIGSYALSSNDGGSFNTVVGHNALPLGGSNNTVAGSNALGSIAGDRNTGVGDQVGMSEGPFTGYTGSQVSLPSISSGSQNTFIGAGSGSTILNNPTSNCTAVGFHAYCDASNQARLGGPAVTSIGGKVAWSALSDARAKKDIRDLPRGLDFILALHPVEYRLRDGNGRLDMGFVAQEVETLLGEGYNAVDSGGDTARTLSLRYTHLIAPLVRAVQEQQRLIRNLEERLAKAEARGAPGAAAASGD